MTPVIPDEAVCVLVGMSIKGVDPESGGRAAL